MLKIMVEITGRVRLVIYYYSLTKPSLNEPTNDDDKLILKAQIIDYTSS